MESEKENKLPTTSYFVFMAEKRSEVSDKYPNLSVGEFAKKMGEIWKDLSEAEKEEYKKKAKQNKEEMDKISPKNVKKRKQVSAIPIAVIRKLLKLDPEFDKISKEAVILIEKSCELFLQDFAKEASKFKKNRIIDGTNVYDAIHAGASRFAFLKFDIDKPEKLTSLNSASKPGSQPAAGDAAAGTLSPTAAASSTQIDLLMNPL